MENLTMVCLAGLITSSATKTRKFIGDGKFDLPP